MESKQIPIRYVKYGLGNFYGTHIEINSKLKNKKKLRDYIIKHELGHKKEFDLMHEFNIDWKVIFHLMFFVFTNSSTWIDFLPIQIKKNKIIYDLNMIILYSFIIVLIILMIIIF